MDEAGREFLIAELNKSRVVLLESVAGLTEAQATFHASAEKWSVIDCVEHVTAAEVLLLRGIMQAAPAEKVVGSSELEGLILATGANRSRRFEAPEQARPNGRFGSLAEALTAFERARERTVQFVETCENDLRACTVQHPLRGSVTAYECLLLLVMHPIRHATQIQEIKADAAGHAAAAEHRPV